MSYRLSIAERIALTTGFHTSSDSRVLLALASFAHYETGTNACPSIEKLQSRIPDLSLRTIARCLRRLEADGWIVGAHTHRWPTVYRIVLDRLATSATMAKVVVPDHKSDCHFGIQTGSDLTATLSDLTATLSDLTAKVADHPVLDPVLDPKSVARRAPLSSPVENSERDEGESRPPDAAPLHQQTLGLLADINAPLERPERPTPQWGQLADALRKGLGLERKTG